MEFSAQREIFRFLVFNKVKLIEKYEGKFRFAWEILPGGKPTSNPGPFGIEAAREKALVKSGHVTPQILDIFVTWPYYGYASTGGEPVVVSLSKLLNIFLKCLSKYIA